MECLNLITFEKYIPVLTSEEQNKLLTARPTLAQLQDWNERLRIRTSDLEDIFGRAYNKQRKNGK